MSIFDFSKYQFSKGILFTVDEYLLPLIHAKIAMAPSESDEGFLFASTTFYCHIESDEGGAFLKFFLAAGGLTRPRPKA